MVLQGDRFYDCCWARSLLFPTQFSNYDGLKGSSSTLTCILGSHRRKNEVSVAGLSKAASYYSGKKY